MSEREQRAAAPGAESRISKDKCLHAGDVICNPNGVFCEACGMKLVWVQAGQMLQAMNSLSPSSRSQAPVVSGADEPETQAWVDLVAYAHKDGKDGALTIYQITSHYNHMRRQLGLLEKQNASLAAALKSREDVSQWALSQRDLPAGGTVMEGVKGLVERLRERLAPYEALDAEIQQLNGSARIGVPNVRALVSLLRREYASAIGGTTQDMQGMIQELAAHAMSAKRLKAELTAAQEDRERFEHLANCINAWGHFWRYVDDFVPNRQTSQRTASLEEWRINIDAARSQKGGPDVER